MGKDGNNSRIECTPASCTLGADNRIFIPKHFQIDWISGTQAIDAWLWLLALGRYRLLSDKQVQDDPQLEPIRLLILEGKPGLVARPSHAEKAEVSSIAGRLSPVSIQPGSAGSRIPIPKGFELFAPPDSDPKDFTLLLSVEGYCEIWYTSVFKKAVLLSLENSL